jgi:hypothetical protein
MWKKDYIRKSLPSSPLLPPFCGKMDLWKSDPEIKERERENSERRGEYEQCEPYV